MKGKKLSIREIVNLITPSPTDEEVREVKARVWSSVMAELKNHDTSLRSLSGDGWNVGPVNLREFQVLTALSELGESNPRQVRLIVQNWAERTDIVDILLTLDRLVIKRKFVEHRLVAVEGKSGRLLYRMTDEGDRALRRAREEGKSLYEWADCKDGAAERIR